MARNSTEDKHEWRKRSSGLFDDKVCISSVLREDVQELPNQCILFEDCGLSPWRVCQKHHPPQHPGAAEIWQGDFEI